MYPFRFACATHEGKTHDANEDRWLADPDNGLFLVADGMANAIAPEAVLQHLPGLFAGILASDKPLSQGSLRQEIESALIALNTRVRDTMREQQELGLGTTLVLALLRAGHALIAHLGDSRAYLLRGDKLAPLTCDHSYFRELVQRGVLTEEEVSSAVSNGGPTRFLGMAYEPKADVRVLELAAGDRVLLCSDGLTAMLGDGEIEEILAKRWPAQDSCDELVAAANAAGGLDNVTALLIDVGEE
jgi:protein phosphatase